MLDRSKLARVLLDTVERKDAEAQSFSYVLSFLCVLDIY